MSEDYFRLQTAPGREKRLKAGVAYGGTLCGFAGSFGCGPERKNGARPCMDISERSFSQGSICVLLPAIGTLGTLPGAAILLHGAAGCGSSLHAANCNARAGHAARGEKSGGALWFSTAMNETDVITGGEKKLSAAIEEIDKRWKLDAIIVVTGCVPGVTGDDVDSVVSEARGKSRAKILAVRCEGFKSKIWATAYDAYYHAFGKSLFEKPPGTPDTGEEEAALTVNLLNVSSMGRTDELELERLLKLAGLRVNIFPVFAKPLEMWKVTRAALSISVCPTHDDYLLNHLKDKYGVPYVLRHMPIGVKNTSLWLRDIGAALGREKEVEDIIWREELQLKLALGPFLPLFRGKKVFLSAGEYRALATANLLAELGFEISALRPFHYDKFADTELEKLMGLGADFVLNVADCQPFEEASLIKKLRPDLFMGHLVCNQTASKLGIPTHTIYNTGLNYVGYKGVFELARRLWRHLRNPSFHKALSKRAKLPYHKSWYSEDAFKFIKTPSEKEA
jgi:nitrogenase molybdenum-iron protein alpha chain